MKFFKYIKEILILCILLFKDNFTKIRNITPNHNLNKKLLISLTAKKSRFYFLELVLSSIFNQTIHPDEIILWIDKNEKKYLRRQIIKFKKKGLKIKFCNNLKSYNKIYNLLAKKDKYIITLDDDIIYNINTVSSLINKFNNTNRNYIVANRIHKIKLINKLPIKYKDWQWNSTSKRPNILNFQTGVYGVLYPPNCFYKDVNNRKIFQKLAPDADDIWLYWMIRLNKKKVIWSGFNKTNYSLLNFDSFRLSKLNVGDSGNDKQLKNMIAYYGFPKK
mgnify:CR=1 FL=1